MFVTCYNEKVTYIISKSRTFLDNPSVIPSTQRKNMNVNSLLLENLYELIVRAWPWRMWNLVVTIYTLEL